MVSGEAAVTVAGLQARGGGEDSALIFLAGCDPVRAIPRTGRRMISGYAPRFIAGSFTRISLSAGFIRRESAPYLYHRINSRAQGEVRDAPPSQGWGITAKDGPANEFGGIRLGTHRRRNPMAPAHQSAGMEPTDVSANQSVEMYAAGAPAM
jgi:hypothetical protein